jgi:phosphoserine/homoserine phosphotransferase
MKLYCLDLEGVLIPEIWIEVAKRFRLDSLRLTTRDIPDYDKLMRTRLAILKKGGIRLRDIQKVISGMRPLPGARNFLDKLRAHGPVIILSDTYYEFAGPLIRRLGGPVLLCNWLKTDRNGYISKYVLRQKNGKYHAVQALVKLGFEVVAVGDSYNDLAMLKESKKGIFFRAPTKIARKYPSFPRAESYERLFKCLTTPTS